MQKQTFVQVDAEQWLAMEQFPGTTFLPLAEPVPEGSIHLLKLKAGTTIPLHTHPCDEYVYVLSGIVETGKVRCSAGTFWCTPAYIQQGSHRAITDVEIMTIRLGKMGEFEAVNDVKN
ncbi:MAG: cupin domain-containing protein [Cyanobacteria bacterium P01_C01_bin.118]